MKKTLAFIIVLAILMTSLAGCGSNKNLYDNGYIQLKIPEGFMLDEEMSEKDYYIYFSEDSNKEIMIETIKEKDITNTMDVYMNMYMNVIFETYDVVSVSKSNEFEAVGYYAAIFNKILVDLGDHVRGCYYVAIDSDEVYTIISMISANDEDMEWSDDVIQSIKTIGKRYS